MIVQARVQQQGQGVTQQVVVARIMAQHSHLWERCHSHQAERNP